MDFKNLKVNKPTLIVAIIAGAMLLFLGWELFTEFSPATVKVLDARVTFQFTAYAEKEEYFVSYSLENTRAKKTQALVRVRLGEQYLGGHIFRETKAANDTVVLGPMETKVFTTKFEIPKSRKDEKRNFVARARVKRVFRA